MHDHDPPEAERRRLRHEAEPVRDDPGQPARPARQAQQKAGAARFLLGGRRRHLLLEDRAEREQQRGHERERYRHRQNPLSACDDSPIRPD
jgi:hypothetical protein